MVDLTPTQIAERQQVAQKELRNVEDRISLIDRTKAQITQVKEDQLRDVQDEANRAAINAEAKRQIDAFNQEQNQLMLRREDLARQAGERELRVLVGAVPRDTPRPEERQLEFKEAFKPIGIPADERRRIERALAGERVLAQRVVREPVIIEPLVPEPPKFKIPRFEAPPVFEDPDFRTDFGEFLRGERPAFRPREAPLFTEAAGGFFTGGLAELGRRLQEGIPRRREPTTEVGALRFVTPEGVFISEQPVLLPTEREVFISDIPGITGKTTAVFKETGRQIAGFLEVPEDILKLERETALEQGKILKQTIVSPEAVTVAGFKIAERIRERPFEAGISAAIALVSPKVIGKLREPKITRTFDLGRTEAIVVGERVVGKQITVSGIEAGQKKFLASTVARLEGVTKDARTLTVGRGGIAIQRLGRRGPSPKVTFRRFTTRDIAEEFLIREKPFVRTISIADVFGKGVKPLRVEAFRLGKRTALERRAVGSSLRTRQKFVDVGVGATKKGIVSGRGISTVDITEIKPTKEIGVKIKPSVKPITARVVTPTPKAVQESVEQTIKGIEKSVAEIEAQVVVTPQLFGEAFAAQRLRPLIEEEVIVSPKAAELFEQRVAQQVTPISKQVQRTIQKQRTQIQQLTKVQPMIKVAEKPAVGLVPGISLSTAQMQKQISQQVQKSVSETQQRIAQTVVTPTVPTRGFPITFIPPPITTEDFLLPTITPRRIGARLVVRPFATLEEILGIKKKKAKKKKRGKK